MVESKFLVIMMGNFWVVDSFLYEMNRNTEILS